MCENKQDEALDDQVIDPYEYSFDWYQIKRAHVNEEATETVF